VGVIDYVGPETPGVACELADVVGDEDGSKPTPLSPVLRNSKPAIKRPSKKKKKKKKKN
jgi:hypothetical protein